MFNFLTRYLAARRAHRSDASRLLRYLERMRQAREQDQAENGNDVAP